MPTQKLERRFATAIRNNTESPYRFIQDPNGKISRYFTYEDARGHLYGSNLEDSIVIDIERLIKELGEK